MYIFYTIFLSSSIYLICVSHLLHFIGNDSSFSSICHWIANIQYTYKKWPFFYLKTAHIRASQFRSPFYLLLGTISYILKYVWRCVIHMSNMTFPIQFAEPVRGKVVYFAQPVRSANFRIVSRKTASTETASAPFGVWDTPRPLQSSLAVL